MNWDDHTNNSGKHNNENNNYNILETVNIIKNNNEDKVNLNKNNVKDIKSNNNNSNNKEINSDNISDENKLK